MVTNRSSDVHPLPFRCPRCRQDASEEHYGPCASCRSELRTTQRLDAKAGVVADYVPKMNVTPNAVASKE